ncbi:hypothetical protein TrST_g12091 [Triparma strigata]|uniref:CHAT domain-containing protein n=1 Tax=Triparma strigata TaxID=1606541 RepID=A0A9W7BQV1_9STRA|nr:hypothetical protein TrST_g12091 [Triparma strigata]
MIRERSYKQTKRCGGESCISVLYSAPLVGSTATNSPNTTLPILNWAREYDKVKSAINDSRRSISVSRDVCTVDNFRKTLTLGTKVLHYIGHGASNYVPFENGRGGVHAVRNSKLGGILTAGAGSENALRLVFLNSCLSRSAGEVFVESGVPHVICIGDATTSESAASNLEDDCAVSFLSGFYLALCSGKSVKDSFEIGKASVRAMDEIYSQVDYGLQADLFNLLGSGDHNEVLFGDDVEEGSVIEVDPHQSRATEVSKENLPSNPCHFEGRQFELYGLVERVINNRVVTVSGGFGMGKSTLAICAGRYLFDRAHFNSVCYVKVSSAITLWSDISSALRSLGFGNNDGGYYDDGITVDVEFLHSVKDEGILLVLDGSENLIERGALKQFRSLLKIILTHTASLKIILTSSKDAIGRLMVTTESVLEMHPLGKMEVAKMLMMRSPTLRRNYLNRMKFMEEVSKHEALEFLRGNPFRVGLLASLLQRLPPQKRNLDEVLRLFKIRTGGGGADGVGGGDDKDGSDSDDSLGCEGNRGVMLTETEFIDKECLHLVEDICNLHISGEDSDDEDDDQHLFTEEALVEGTVLSPGLLLRNASARNSFTSDSNGLRRRGSSGNRSSRGSGTRVNLGQAAHFITENSSEESQDLLLSPASTATTMGMGTPPAKPTANRAPLSGSFLEVKSQVMGRKYFDIFFGSPLMLLFVLGTWFLKLALNSLVLENVFHRSIFFVHFLLDIGLLLAVYYLWSLVGNKI